MIKRIIILILLIIINGIYSSCELAFLSIDKVRLHEKVSKGNKKAILISKIIKDSSSFLSTIQICITLAGFLASAFAADYFADYLVNIISISCLSTSALRSILMVLITIILAYFTLVFGELVPKRVAISDPYKIAKRYAGLIRISNILFYPLVKILTISTDAICKLFRIKKVNTKLTEKDIKKTILLGRSEGILEEQEKEYILNIFDFNDINVSKVMTPKKDVVLLNIDDDMKENVYKMKNSKYTRFPVYKDNVNNIIGIINVKDFIYEKKDNKDVLLKDVLRKVTRIKHNVKIDDAFRYMQEHNESFCVVYKEDDFVGVLTIEDAVEEIVGNIYDEYD